jgi:hypothetical protein
VFIVIYVRQLDVISPNILAENATAHRQFIALLASVSSGISLQTLANSCSKSLKIVSQNEIFCASFPVCNIIILSKESFFFGSHFAA